MTTPCAASRFGVCEWFALCTNPAIGLLPHPVLKLVPVCQRCCDKVEALDADAAAKLVTS
jgi:hypothetical protein